MDGTRWSTPRLLVWKLWLPWLLYVEWCMRVIVYEMIVEMEGLSVEFQILGKHCAQLLCPSNGTRAVVVRPLEGREGIYFMCQFSSWYT